MLIINGVLMCTAIYTSLTAVQVSNHDNVAATQLMRSIPYMLRCCMLLYDCRDPHDEAPDDDSMANDVYGGLG
jgi:hypothetical protein